MYYLLKPLVRPCGALLLGLLTACSGGTSTSSTIGDPADIITTNDFESVVGWGGLGAEQLTRVRAHSGNYAIKVDSAREFSFTYDAPLGIASVHPLKGVRVEGWVLLTDATSRESLEVQLVAPDGQKRYGTGYLFADHNPTYGKWAPFTADFSLPATQTGADHLKVFLWRADAARPAYLDDVILRGLE